MATAQAVGDNNPHRKDTMWSWMLFWASFAVGWVPLFGPPLSHVIDRMKNNHLAHEELKARAGFYRHQVAQTLGIDPASVKASDLVEAAAINPMLKAAIKDVYAEESKENNSSALVNGAMTAVSVVIPGATVADTAIKAGSGIVKAATQQAAGFAASVAVPIAAGMLPAWLAKDKLATQDVVDGIEQQLAAAKHQGVNPLQTITPQKLFLLRVTQDEVLDDQIRKDHGKAFHKMNEDEQALVMTTYQALADAATSESYAVGTGSASIRDMATLAPNLNSRANRYAIGNRNASFTDRLMAERNARVAASAGVPANDGSFVGRVEAGRAANDNDVAQTA